MKHRDPAFLKRHLQSPEGAGQNILSVFCCNYYLIKLLAEPFLNTTRSVQDAVDNTAECVQITRSRMSCTDFLSSANLANLPEEGDLEEGLASERFLEKERQRKGRTYFEALWAWLSGVLTFLFTPCTNVSTTKVLKWVSLLCAIAIVMTFIYASFTV